MFVALIDINSLAKTERIGNVFSHYLLLFAVTKKEQPAWGLLGHTRVPFQRSSEFPLNVNVYLAPHWLQKETASGYPKAAMKVRV